MHELFPNYFLRYLPHDVPLCVCVCVIVLLRFCRRNIIDVVCSQDIEAYF